MPPRYVDQLLTPERLARGFELIRGVGDSPLVKYDGTGLYFVDFKPSGEVSVEILPDCEWLRSPVTGGMMLNANGEVPESDDPPYASPQEYYAIARKYQKQVSNRYITDVEHVMTLAAPNLPSSPKVYRIEGAEFRPIDLLGTAPLRFMAKPGSYRIQ